VSVCFLARTVLFLVSPASSCVAGQIIDVNGGRGINRS
jgi:hypothetical protein